MFAQRSTRPAFALALLALALLFGLLLAIPAIAQTSQPASVDQAPACPGITNPGMTGHTPMMAHGMRMGQGMMGQGMMGQGMMMGRGMMGRGMHGMMAGQGMAEQGMQSCPMAAPSATGVITGSAVTGSAVTGSAVTGSAVTGSSTDAGTVQAKLGDLLKTAHPEHGQQLTAANGCIACHSTDASQPMVGPTWHDLATTAATRVPGQSAADYLYTSIVQPNAALAPGYASNIMPQNFGQRLGEQDLADIVGYLLTLHE